MTHDEAQRWLTLPVEELDEATRDRLEDHLSSCAACRNEAAVLQRLHDEVKRAAIGVSDDDLIVARHMLFRTLRDQTARPAWNTRVLDWLGLGAGPVLRPVLIAGVLAVAAFAAGALAFRPSLTSSPGFHLAAYDPTGGSPSSGPIQVLNLRILHQNEETGDIEFEFEALQPSHVRGSLHDPAVQAILARALVSSQNPGVRLRAANVIASQVGDRGLAGSSEDLVKESLISALMYDQNRGVRREALKALEPFLPDSAATAAIVHVLKREDNVGMRIAAINALDLTKFTRASSREQVRDALRDRSEVDANHYIRIRAASALQEERP